MANIFDRATIDIITRANKTIEKKKPNPTVNREIFP